MMVKLFFLEIENIVSRDWLGKVGKCVYGIVYVYGLWYCKVMGYL